MKKISIILPVYNTEKYIAKCIESILSQTYKNFELIIINDGSKDGTENIIKEYAQKDTRIKYKSVENGGVYKARNIALGMVTGEYICFIDSDDWADVDFLQDFIENISVSNKRMVVQDFKRISVNDEITRSMQGYDNQLFYFPKDLEKYISNYKFTQGYLWNKIFIKEILVEQNIVFNETMIANADENFCLSYVQHIDEVLFLKKDHYNYVERNGSITKKIPTFLSELQHLLGFMQFCDFLVSHDNSNFVRKYTKDKFNHLFDHVLRNSIYRKNYTRKERISFLKILFNENKNRNNLLEPNTSLKKIDYFLFKNKMFLLLDMILRAKTKYN